MFKGLADSDDDSEGGIGSDTLAIGALKIEKSPFNVKETLYSTFEENPLDDKYVYPVFHTKPKFPAKADIEKFALAFGMSGLLSESVQYAYKIGYNTTEYKGATESINQVRRVRNSFWIIANIIINSLKKFTNCSIWYTHVLRFNDGENVPHRVWCPFILRCVYSPATLTMEINVCSFEPDLLEQIVSPRQSLFLFPELTLLTSYVYRNVARKVEGLMPGNKFISPELYTMHKLYNAYKHQAAHKEGHRALLSIMTNNLLFYLSRSSYILKIPRQTNHWTAVHEFVDKQKRSPAVKFWMFMICVPLVGDHLISSDWTFQLKRVDNVYKVFADELHELCLDWANTKYALF